MIASVLSGFIDEKIDCRIERFRERSDNRSSPEVSASVLLTIHEKARSHANTRTTLGCVPRLTFLLLRTSGNDNHIRLSSLFKGPLLNSYTRISSESRIP
jgi:hypothetical protein